MTSKRQALAETFPELQWDSRGLIPVIAQDKLSGQIRMVAYANAEALAATLATREAHFFSRSRGKLWKKGESSGHVLAVEEIWADCDGDTIIYLVHPRGPSCHTGAQTCFFRRLDAVEQTQASHVTMPPARDKAASAAGAAGPESPALLASPTMLALDASLSRRKHSDGNKSYTKSLLDAGMPRIAEKIREEAEELIEAATHESDERVACEAADLIYHQLVALVARDIPWQDVVRVLHKRFGVSGHDEKRSRGKSHPPQE